MTGHPPNAWKIAPRLRGGGSYLRLMRWHKPAGALLLFWPCAWSLALFGGTWQHYALFALGAWLMRSAGCVINDLWDRDIDAQVERTRGRPLASGELQPRQAFALLAVLLILSALVAIALGLQTVLWSLAALPLVTLYPLMKRFTWWPQAFLGLTFNWGALVACASVTGTVLPSALWLYSAGFFWTLGYDTLYAMQDREDDATAGVKSTARLFGKRALPIVAGFYALSLLCLAMASPSWLLVLPALHFIFQLWQGSQGRFSQAFAGNMVAGGLVCLTLVV